MDDVPDEAKTAESPELEHAASMRVRLGHDQVIAFLRADVRQLSAPETVPFLSALASATGRDGVDPERMVVFLEGFGPNSVRIGPGACTCVRCRPDELPSFMLDPGLGGEVWLFVGEMPFIEAAASLSLKDLPQEGEVVGRVGKMHPADIVGLDLASRTEPVLQMNLLMLLQMHMHHGQGFDAQEASMASLPVIDKIVPKMPDR